MGGLAKLNFKLAYKRVRDELEDQARSGRAFVDNPYELDLVDLARDDWLDELKAKVIEGEYQPDPVEYCGAPKGKDLIRPGIRMSLADRVVYTACVGACVRKIVSATRWSQRRIDFAPLFHATKPGQRRWLLKPYVGWDGWTTQSLTKLDVARTSHVATVDIAGYFENISIARLRSELLRIDADPGVVGLISTCLLQWALVRDRGVPQGVLASDVLAKLYLESVDKRLKDAGLSHVRYVDDIRIFCRSYPQARDALVLTTELLRERGLTVQSAKTRVRLADADLRAEFAGAVPAIRALHQDYVSEALQSGLLPEDEASIPASAIDDLITSDPDSVDPEVFRQAFEHFVVSVESPNQSMFRYLLRRFAAGRDAYAVQYCSKRLTTAPEAIPEILRYFADLGSDDRARETFVRSALSSRSLAMYPYSRWLLLKWLAQHGSSRAPTLAAVRKQAFGADQPDYVQAQARAVLARIGDDSDLDQMAVLLAASRDPLERSQLLCSLRRMEKGRRNALVGRVKSDSEWGRLAAKYVKQTASPN